MLLATKLAKVHMYRHDYQLKCKRLKNNDSLLLQLLQAYYLEWIRSFTSIRPTSLQLKLSTNLVNE